MGQRRLTDTEYRHALELLRIRDRHINLVLKAYGTPPMWSRDPGFPSLLFTILEQQVSLESARAVYGRLCSLANDLTPEVFLGFGDSALREIGFSRQKTEYCRLVAKAVVDGTLDLKRIEQHDDDIVRNALIGIKGIGPWTADIYLLHSLGRPDIWPTGDLALRIAVQEVKELQSVPEESELVELGDSYRPWRSVATRVFWHHYLSKRRRGLS